MSKLEQSKNILVTLGEYYGAGLTWGDIEKSGMTFEDLADRDKFEELMAKKEPADFSGQGC